MAVGLEQAMQQQAPAGPVPDPQQRPLPDPGQEPGPAGEQLGPEGEVAASPQEEAMMERAITAVMEALYQNEKFLGRTQAQLKKADQLDQRMAGIALSLIYKMDAELKKQFQMHAGYEFFAQLATVVIEELMDIAEASGREEVTEPDFHERVLMLMVTEHGKQYEQSPEAKAMAQENMVAMMADGTAEEAAQFVQQRGGPVEGPPQQTPMAAGIRQGLEQPNA